MARPSLRSLDDSALGSARAWAVIGMALLVMIGFGLIVPALPQFASQFGVGEAGIGLVITGFALTRLVGDLFAGSWIDRFGERPITAVGVGIVGVSSIAAGAAQSYWQLVVYRGLGGVGSALFLGGLFAYLIGTVPERTRGRAMGVFQASFGIGFLVGPLLGGILIAAWGVNIPLYVYGVVCLVCFPLTMMVMKPVRISSAVLGEVAADEVPGPREPALSRLRPLLRSSAYRAALMAGMLGFFVIAAEQTLIPGYWVDTLGRSKASSGVPFAVTAIFGIVVAWHAGSLSDRRGRKAALVPALAVMVAASVAMGFATTATLVVLWMGVLGAAGGYARPGPTSMVADVASDSNRGVAVSGYRIATDIGQLIGPIMAGTVAEYLGFKAAFAAVAGFVAIAFILAARAEETAPAMRAPAPVPDSA